MNKDETILELKDILKIYPNGIIACNKVSLKIKKGSIHAVVGENGAGKTSLMKVVSGLEIPQEGDIYYQGEKVEIKNPFEAIKKGIGMVHQHFMLVQGLTVAQNLVLGMEPGKYGILDGKEIRSIASKISEKYRIEVPIEKKIRDIPMGIRQRVEILKALLRNSKILILDEPTSMLTPQETERLFVTIQNLKKLGKTIVFISHKLKEVKAISEVISIMRRGRVIFTGDTRKISEKEIAQLMMEKNIPKNKIVRSKEIGEEVLKVDKLNYLDEEKGIRLNCISFKLRREEILGIAGIDENGQEELVYILNGLIKRYAGIVKIMGKNIKDKSSREIGELGVSCIPKDKLKYGVAQDASFLDNLIVNKYYKYPFLNGLRLNKSYISQYAHRLISTFSIEVSKLEAPVSNLSGGNIQKVILAREFSEKNNLVIAYEPIQGLDIGAIEIVHNLLFRAREQGVGILLISSDLDELLELSTRILVLYNGKIVAHLNNLENISQRDIGPYMLGIKEERVET
jgi:simple sugar transport system ATP-binding protein